MAGTTTKFVDLSTINIAKADAPTFDENAPLTPFETLMQALSGGIHPKAGHLAYAYGLVRPQGLNVGLASTRSIHGTLKDCLEKGRPVPTELKAQVKDLVFHRNMVNTAAFISNWLGVSRALIQNDDGAADYAAVIKAKLAKRIGEPYLPTEKEFWAPPTYYRVTGRFTNTPELVAATKGKAPLGTFEVVADCGGFTPTGALVRMSAALFPKCWKLWPELDISSMEILDEARELNVEVVQVK